MLILLAAAFMLGVFFGLLIVCLLVVYKNDGDKSMAARMRADIRN